MADPLVVESIRQAVLSELDGTPYACSALFPLAGGYANFVFRGVLKEKLANGASEVAIKHGQDHAATDPNMLVTTYRCVCPSLTPYTVPAGPGVLTLTKRLEKECLVATASLHAVGDAGYALRTPHLYYFNEESNTQVQEYVPNTVDLKMFALGQSAPESEYLAIGRAVGKWLHNLHEWGQLPAQSTFREYLGADTCMQSLKNVINYGWLIDRINDYPAALSDARAVFEDVQKMANAELADPSRHRIIHGDFWTGK